MILESTRCAKHGNDSTVLGNDPVMHDNDSTSFDFLFFLKLELLVSGSLHWSFDCDGLPAWWQGSIYLFHILIIQFIVDPGNCLFIAALVVQFFDFIVGKLFIRLGVVSIGVYLQTFLLRDILLSLALNNK